MTPICTFVDLSGNNPIKDAPAAMRAIKDAGHAGVYLKATQGRSYDFARLELWHGAAVAAGLRVGAYHFAVPDARPGDAAGEAADLLDRIKGLALDWPLVLDLEQNGSKEHKLAPLPPAHLVAWAAIWLHDVEFATGRKPLLYTGPAFWRAQLGRHGFVADWPVWVAAYPAKTPQLEAAPPKLGSVQPAVWQYTGHGHVPGIAGDVDINRAYVDLDAL